MLELLRDQMWQSIGVLLGVIALIVSIIGVVITRKQDKKKDMTYQVISDTPILSVQKEIEGRAEIRFDGKVIKNLRLAILKLWNSGRQPVLPSDFIEPISFLFGDDAEILDTETLTVEPHHLKVSLERGPGSITILPLLLNPSDSIQFKVLVSGMEKKIQLEYRIVDLKKITEFDETKSQKTRYTLIFAIIFAMCAISTVAAYTYSLFDTPTTELLLIIITLLALFTLSSATFVDFSHQLRLTRQKKGNGAASSE